jgi:hypothetical protein
MTKPFNQFLLLCIAFHVGGCVKPSETTRAKGKVPPVVQNESQAVRLVADTIKGRAMTALPEECLGFHVEAPEIDTLYVDVRETHNDRCGGDPETAPRLFTIIVDKQSGAMKTDAESTGEFKPLTPK